MSGAVVNSPAVAGPRGQQSRPGHRTTPQIANPMSNRYALTAKLERLRAGLAKAERDPQLAAANLPSAELYALAERRIDELINEITERVEACTNRSPDASNG